MSIDFKILISSIQEKPPLCDQSNNKYMDRDVATNLWKEVATECNITGRNFYQIILDYYY